jgi:SAM-dependent methyltransferase
MQGIQLPLTFTASPEIATAVAPEPPKHQQDQPATVISLASGEKAKAREILAAIRTVKLTQSEHRAATPEERQTLARFSGFGPVALSLFPNPTSGRYKDASWQTLGEELRSLLTEAEWQAAKRSTFNAFYTSSTVIRAMYQGLKRLGLPDAGLVLEPGCGPGRFPLLAPSGMRFIGVELDSISGRIARALHPEHDIRIENFRDTVLPEASIDGVIGNVPFADVKLEYHGQKLSLHDFFFAKSVDALRPGGVLALVTSHFTLDKQNAALREYLGSKADFVGAIRLPSDAFKREGTAVVTDIVFLRKRSPEQPARHADPDWLETRPLAIDGVDIPINRYFLNHPEMVLGEFSRNDRLYDSGYSLTSNGDLTEQLQDAIGRLPEFPPFLPSIAAEKPALVSRRSDAGFTPPALPHVAEGSFFVGLGGAICQSVGGEGIPVVYGGSALSAHGNKTGRRLTALVGLRDRARRVLQSQNEGWPESHRQQARRDLNYDYDRFVATYGPINKTTFSETAEGDVVRRMPNLVKFREDPDAMLVMSLEEYDDVTGKAAKAAIMSKDVVGQRPPITSVATAAEGLLVSLDRKGVVDLPFISSLYGKERGTVIRELGDLIFPDPESRTWQTADAYLSGNVRAKLAAAEKAGPAFARNVKALGAVQPEDVLPGDIDANLGAPWIPESDIQTFAAELFHVEPSSVPVAHVKKDAVWSVEADYAALQSVAATSEYGTPRAKGTWLLELALNMKTPTIYDSIMNGGREERIVNHEATLAAR